MLDAVTTIDPETSIHWTHVEHPVAEAVLSPEGAAPFDVIAFYDVPGVLFTEGNSPFAHLIRERRITRRRQSRPAPQTAGRPG